ncbi:MAG TPA: cytochrome c peroxidase, partial [Longimicrobiales bacterium]|nr:cytochrome c peroxidase [Longimicrobiales bacterium]
MRVRVSLVIPVLIAALALSACTDAPTQIDEGSAGAQFARGGSKGGGDAPSGEINIIQLGQILFETTELSVNRNQSCQTCHEPSMGFAGAVGAEEKGSVIQGSVPHRFGDRRPPSAAYATLAPLYTGGNNPSGGNFWDGRATGRVLGNPAADQAMGPFLNPNEQALPDMACVAYRIRFNPELLDAYDDVWTDGSINIAFPVNAATVCSTPAALAGGSVSIGLTGTDLANATTVYHNVARSIAAFEASLNTFSAKFDRGQLTAQEARGQKLFSSKGKCHQCHDTKGSFADFRFHNLGVPKNPANPVYNYTSAGFDPGLGGVTGNPSHLGKFRTPTLRNVALGEFNGRTYMHNGAFVSLKQV